MAATTEQVFQSDAYVREFDAAVTEVRDGAVALDRTAFYPGGGGQPHDLGSLTAGGRTLAVVRVSKDGDHIFHELDGDPPEPGAAVAGALDWDRRYELMRTHTALHILCGVVWRDYGAKVTGGNMQPLAGRMDFEFEQMGAELVREIEEKVNVEVAADRPIAVSFLDRAAADVNPDLIRTKVNLLPAGITRVRVVEIEGARHPGRRGHARRLDRRGRADLGGRLQEQGQGEQADRDRGRLGLPGHPSRRHLQPHFRNFVLRQRPSTVLSATRCCRSEMRGSCRSEVRR